MPSVAELYNQEVLDGHREAIAALRDLLARETDPAERRKLANALLRARPVKLAAANESEPPARKSPADAGRQSRPDPARKDAALAHLGGLLAMLNRDDDEEDDLDAMIDDEIDQPLTESS